MMKNDHFQPFDVASIFWIYEEDIDSNKDKKRGKLRPGLITGFTPDGKAVFQRITTKFKNKSPFIKLRYYKIQDLKSAGLNRESYIDIKDSRIIKLDNIVKRGSLSEKDIDDLIDFKQTYPERLRKFQLKQINRNRGLERLSLIHI